MAATTQSDGRNRRGAAALALAVGGALALSGAARLWTAWQAESARIGLEALQRDGGEPSAVLDDIAQSLASAGQMGPYIVPWATSDRGGSLEALLRLRAGDPAARDVLEAALAGAPGDPNGWAWLARLRLKEGRAVAAGQALRVSLLAGQVVPGAMGPRLGLALELYPHLDPDTQHMVQRQVRLVWMLTPQDIPPLMRVPDYIPVITAALAAVTPSDEQQFRRHYRLDPLP